MFWEKWKGTGAGEGGSAFLHGSLIIIKAALGEIRTWGCFIFSAYIGQPFCGSSLFSSKKSNILAL